MTNTSRVIAGVCCRDALRFGSAAARFARIWRTSPRTGRFRRPISSTDGRSERPLVENTVARGSIADDDLFVPKESNAFPLPLTQELLKRGQERYKIFCTPCHGIQGDGNGMVAMRGMKHPPSYHQDRVCAQVPNGYFYDVITNGFGAHAQLLRADSAADRWAIIAYVRALQLSRNASPELPPSFAKSCASASGRTPAKATGGSAK